jgi:hypothetical protein
MKTCFAALAAALLWSGVAQATPITYAAALSGPAEAPPNASPGTGFAVVVIDTATNYLSVDVSFSGLIGNTTASHIHCCTAVPGTGAVGVATQLPTFVGFPLGVTSGFYFNTFDLALASSWNPAFVAANGGTPLTAEAALAAGLVADRAYLNIHSTVFPGGEIRGFLTPVAGVPEPGSMILLGTGLIGAGVRRWRNRRRPVA